MSASPRSLRKSCRLALAATGFFLTVCGSALMIGCKPTPAPITPGSPFSASGTASVGVVYCAAGTASLCPNLATWTYYVSDNAGFDRVSIALAQKCNLPSSTPGGTNTPSGGPSANWVVNFNSTVTSAKITIPCDASAGGTASVQVLTTSGTTVSGPTFSVLGPR